MALNEIEMNNFSEGSTGAGGRVDELTFPVDISHGSRSPQAHVNEKDSDSELNLQKENVGAGPSGGSSEDDELVHPVSEPRSEVEVEGERRVTFLEPIREEDQDDGAGRTHQLVEDLQNTDHTVAVEESDGICRTCGPDEEVNTEPDNLLVKLGCNCRGSLCRMHRKCILEWYGPRICRENNYMCELCNALLHGRIQSIVYRALVGQDSGKDIIIKALGIGGPRSGSHPRRPRRNANVTDAPALQAQDENAAHPDSYRINIVEIAHAAGHIVEIQHDPAPAARQPHYIWRRLAQNQSEGRQTYYGSARGGYPMCVVVFIILVLIGLGFAGVGKLH